MNMKYLVCKLEMSPRREFYLPRARPIDASQKFTNKLEAIRFALRQGISGISVIEITRGGIPFDGPFKIVWPGILKPCK
jgi:hypothetical protein